MVLVKQATLEIARLGAGLVKAYVPMEPSVKDMPNVLNWNMVVTPVNVELDMREMDEHVDATQILIAILTIDYLVPVNFVNRYENNELYKLISFLYILNLEISVKF